MQKSKEEIEVLNKRFLELQDYYKENPTCKKTWDEMFFIAYDCALNTLKKKVGRYRNDLEDLAIDVTCTLMERIKYGTKSNKDWRVEFLPTCIHYIVLKRLYNQQTVFEEKIIVDSEKILKT